MKQNEKVKMAKYLWAILILLLLSLFVTALTAQNIGYLVVIDSRTSNETVTFKTQSMDSIFTHFRNATGMKLDTCNLFTRKKIYFEYRNSDLIFYVEKKRVIKKKTGKLVYRKIKKHDNYISK